MGSDDSLIKWMTPDEGLARGYAKARGGGEVLSENISISKVADFGRDAARGNPSSLISGIVRDAMKSNDVNVSKAKEARAEFISHFGNSPINVIDLWKDQESKEVTTKLLKSLGYDSLKVREGGIDTFGLLGSSSINPSQLPLKGKPITDFFGS